VAAAGCNHIGAVLSCCAEDSRCPGGSQLCRWRQVTHTTLYCRTRACCQSRAIELCCCNQLPWRSRRCCCWHVYQQPSQSTSLAPPGENPHLPLSRPVGVRSFSVAPPPLESSAASPSLPGSGWLTTCRFMQIRCQDGTPPPTGVRADCLSGITCCFTQPAWSLASSSLPLRCVPSHPTASIFTALGETIVAASACHAGIVAGVKYGCQAYVATTSTSV
jgi:hypothetical protein